MAIHPTAIVAPEAELDSSVEVGPYCVIDPQVCVGAGCRLYQGVYLTGWTEIGENCEFHPGVIVGHVPQDTKYGGERSYCRIGRGTVLREYVTIHRGTMPESYTLVGEDCFLLGGSHVAHNCKVGNRVTLINNVLLGGHVTVEDRVTMGGAAVVHQFARIGELAMVAGNARVTMDVIPFGLLDPTGRVAGLNRIGLRRAGVSREQVQELRAAYRLLFAARLPFREALKQTRDLVKFLPGQRLLRFLEGESQRGLAGRTKVEAGSERGSRLA